MRSLASTIRLLAGILPLLPPSSSTSRAGLVPSSSFSFSSSPSPSPGADVAADDVTHPNTVKILVCGDSISQGQEGDFTWRYRLWEWFQSNALSQSSPVSTAAAAAAADDDDDPPTTGSAVHLAPALQYVGPYNGTLPAAVGPAGVDLAHPQTWGPYHRDVDPAFSPGGGSRHAAVYGRPAWLLVDAVEDLVDAHRPDLVVLHLGFNDFGWWAHSAADLVESMRKLVANARRGRADVAVLIADVSHRLRVEGRGDIPGTTDEYNRLLGDRVGEWTTPESPVVVVRVSEEYACHVGSCPAGIDGLHPNALGDFQIARAYTKVLHEKFLFGPGPLAIPPLKSIPGMKATSRFNFHPMNTLLYPPVGIFMGVSFLCLVVVVALRPRWMRGNGGAVSKYELLPTTREGMEGL